MNAKGSLAAQSFGPPSTAPSYLGGVAGASVPSTATRAGDYYIITSAGTSQSKTWAVGDRATYEGTSGNWTQTAAQELFGYNAPTAISAAGNTNLTLSAGQRSRVEAATVSAGSGAFTATLTIQSTNAVAGAIVEGRVAMPASFNPLVEIRNLTSGGTLLGSIVGDTVARTWVFRARFDGTNWFLVEFSKLRGASIDELNNVASQRPPRQGIVPLVSATVGCPLATAISAFGTGDFTFEVWANVKAGIGNTVIIGSANSGFEITTNSSTTLLPTAYRKNTGISLAATTAIAAGIINHLVYVRANSVGTWYINGSAAGTGADTSDYSGAVTHIGAAASGGNVGFVFPQAYNYALTQAQVAASFARGAADAADYAGSLVNTAITAGAFVIGFRYRIATAGTTDFTLVGAANSSVGTEFVSTGAGTGTGTATLLGLVLAPDPQAAGLGPQWRDLSGRGSHINLPNEGTSVVVWAFPSGSAGDFGETRVASGFALGRDAVHIPAGYRIARIWCSGNGTFSIGNAASGTEIVNGFTATATTQPATLAAYTTTSRKLYVTLGTATTVTYSVHLERI